MEERRGPVLTHRDRGGQPIGIRDPERMTEATTTGLLYVSADPPGKFGKPGVVA